MRYKTNVFFVLLYISVQNSVQNEILSCLQNGIGFREKYQASVSAFRFKLYALSPQAYKFVRNQFNNNLPHESTIKCWYRNSNLDTEPGINQCSLKILEEKAHEMDRDNQKLVCCLMFDEMSIREHIHFCSKTKKFLGHVTYGGQPEQIANNAIVFLVNGINAKIQVPIAYHFVTTLSAIERKKILLEVLSSKRDIIISNTFDNLPANILMCELLGASLKSNDMKTYFIDANTNHKIYIISCPSHCIKSTVRFSLTPKVVKLIGVLFEHWLNLEKKMISALVTSYLFDIYILK